MKVTFVICMDLKGSHILVGMIEPVLNVVQPNPVARRAIRKFKISRCNPQSILLICYRDICRLVRSRQVRVLEDVLYQCNKDQGDDFHPCQVISRHRDRKLMALPNPVDVNQVLHLLNLFQQRGLLVFLSALKRITHHLRKRNDRFRRLVGGLAHAVVDEAEGVGEEMRVDLRLEESVL
jgi:hypothetical protein